MEELSPTHALGAQAAMVRKTLLRVIRDLHDRFAAGHETTGSRTARGYSMLWADLFAEVYEALLAQGSQAQVLYLKKERVAVVNGCLVYPWRLPTHDDPTKFASSPTRVSAFHAVPPAPMLPLPEFGQAAEPTGEDDDASLEEVSRQVGNAMPVVLCMMRSTPRDLQSITWAVAVLNTDTGQVVLHGEETIWTPETSMPVAVMDVEAFDSGIPAPLGLEPRAHEDPQPDA